MKQARPTPTPPAPEAGGSPDSSSPARALAESTAPLPQDLSRGPAPTCSRKSFWLIAGALGLLCLALRATNLLALPIFNDEAIYLRWAQVIRGEGITWGSSSLHLWVSLTDPKPPLHFWLIALVYHWATDPLAAARMISVLSGVALVPLMMALGNEIGRLMVPRPNQITGTALGILTAILAIFCPFLAFYQRLATADALFTAESLLIVWLSFRWARLSLAGRRAASWYGALGLGLAIGAGLLTRQGVSYTICVMPLAAWIVHLAAAADARAKLPREARPKFRRLFFRGAAQLAAAALIAAALWTPFLTAELTERARSNHDIPGADTPVTNSQLLDEVKRRIFYQSSFTQTSDHKGLAERNAYVAFLPSWDADGNPVSGWLPLYMTYLIFVLALAGLVYTAIRQPAMAVLLGVWLILLLSPLLLVENIFSRYVLAGVPPLLFAAAYLLGDTMLLLWKMHLPAIPKWLAGVLLVLFLLALQTRLFPPGLGRAGWLVWPLAGFLAFAAAFWLLRRLEPRIGKPTLGGVIILLLSGVLLWLPAEEMGRQLFDWQSQTLTEWFTFNGSRVRGDRYQYLTGYTAGAATRNAVAWLLNQVRAQPTKQFVIITDNGWGTPADAVWVYLSPEKNVQVYYTDFPSGRKILVPGKERGTFRLKDDKYVYPPERGVRFDPNAFIYFVTNDPQHDDPHETPAAKFFGPENPNLRMPLTFNGIPGGEKVAVFPVSRP